MSVEVVYGSTYRKHDLQYPSDPLNLVSFMLEKSVRWRLQ